MYPQFALATLVLGSLFSMSSFATELDDKKKRRASAAQPLESIVDIHNSPVILAHPTAMSSGAESIAELQKLRQLGEMRESKLRAWHQSTGKPYPARFAGD